MDKLKSQVANDINWEKVTKHGKEVRHSAWYTSRGCSCRYKYDNFDSHKEGFVANEFPVWMDEIAAALQKTYNLKHKPNSCNENRYNHRFQALGLHADNEKLFKGEGGAADIISLSFGESRTFVLWPNYESEDKCLYPVLEEGDLLAMLGKVQMFWQHGVKQGSNVDGEGTRINLTFRFLCNHEKYCNCCNS